MSIKDGLQEMRDRFEKMKDRFEETKKELEEERRKQRTAWESAGYGHLKITTDQYWLSYDILARDVRISPEWLQYRSPIDGEVRVRRSEIFRISFTGEIEEIK